MDNKTRHSFKKAEEGMDLTEDELTNLYCEAPIVLRERDGLEEMLWKIATMPEHIGAAELRHLAGRAIGL
jgi:hypothetical protein